MYFIKDLIGLGSRRAGRKTRDLIWDFCDKKEKRIEEFGVPMSEFHQGQMIAFREMQWELKRKCTRLQEIN